MNRHLTKYGNNTITRFDIVGSFFVNLFYNEFFKKANSIKQQSEEKSTTEIYKELLVAYSDFTCREEFFKQAVKGTHAYVISNTNQIDMTHKECIDFIVREFIPENIFMSLRENQKGKIFHDAVASVVREFISKVISKYIKMVIDYRQSPESSTILQNEFLDIICLEKDKVYGKFISSKSSNLISVEMYKKNLKSMVDAINKKEVEIKKQASVIEALRKVNEKSAGIIRELQGNIARLNKELRETKNLQKPAIKAVLRKKINTDNTPVDTYETSSVKSSASSKTSNESDTDEKHYEPSISSNNPEDLDGSSLLYDPSDSYY